MDRREQVAASRRQRGDHPADLRPDVRWRAVGQDALRVDRAAEAEMVAMPALERGDIGHPPGRRLDGIQDVHPDLDEVVDEVGHVAVGVEEDACLRMGPDERDVLGMDRLEDPAVHRGRRFS